MLVERTFQEPRGYTEPKRLMAWCILGLAGPVVIGGMFVIGWAFGLGSAPFKTRNWVCVDQAPAAGDLYSRLRALGAYHDRVWCPGKRGQHCRYLGSGQWVLCRPPLAASDCPLAGTIPRGCGPPRPNPWKAPDPCVAASLVHGVSGGVAIAAAVVLANWAALTPLDLCRRHANRCGRGRNFFHDRRDDPRLSVSLRWASCWRLSARPGALDRRLHLIVPSGGTDRRIQPAGDLPGLSAYRPAMTAAAVLAVLTTRGCWRVPGHLDRGCRRRVCHRRDGGAIARGSSDAAAAEQRRAHDRHPAGGRGSLGPFQDARANPATGTVTECGPERSEASSVMQEVSFS